VETPRKYITAVINLRGVSTNFIAMQTCKELIMYMVVLIRIFPRGPQYFASGPEAPSGYVTVGHLLKTWRRDWKNPLRFCAEITLYETSV
jgi:hypothetical protein